MKPDTGFVEYLKVRLRACASIVSKWETMPIQIWVACIVAAFEALCVGGLVAFNPPWGPEKSTLISVSLVVLAWIIGYWQGRKFTSDLKENKSVWLSSILRGIPTGFIVGLCSGIVFSTREFYYMGNFRKSLQLFFTAHQPPALFMWLLAGIVGLLVGIVGGVFVAAFLSLNKSILPRQAGGGL